MSSSNGTSEIVESGEEFNFWNHFNRPKLLQIKLRDGEGKSHGYPIEDDLRHLIEAIDLRMSPKTLGYSHQVTGHTQTNDMFNKSIRSCALQASIGTSESVMMKQALRRLSLMQASEQAALKRSSKVVRLSGVSEACTIKRLYTSMVLEESKCGHSVDERKMDLFELSIAPKSASLNSSHKGFQVCDSCHTELSQMQAVSSQNRVISKPNLTQKRIQKGIASLSKAVSSPIHASSTLNATKNTNIDVISSPSTSSNLIKGKAYPKAFMYALEEGVVLNKPSRSPQATKTTVRNNFPSKKGRQEPLLSSGSSNRCANIEPSNVSSDSRLGANKDNVVNNCHCNPNNCSLRIAAVAKLTKSSRSREKGDCSQSSMSSLCDNSSSTSNSDESNQSGFGACGVRPHMSNNIRWTAIQHVLNQYKGLELTNFKLIKKLGCGDIGTVYLAELIGSKCLFALKVMDVEFLISRKKIIRAQTERDILHVLDHPFLPTLFADFTTDNLLCFVIEYCPGGDLHVLRQRQHGRRFSEPEASFYVAEVLLALEYLHMLGVVYRDLKPENILVREDGHIMLSDFDLSLRCIVNPTLLRSSSVSREEASTDSSCINPHCLHPSWPQISCFTPRQISSSTANTQRIRSDATLQLVAEPTDARSNSFVGTHEYLAPEIIKGDGHGSAVDWWTFGIFLYELLYGRTPFKGSGNEETLANVVSQCLKFPETPSISFYARDLIERLLVKDPDDRLGSMKGATEIKRHPFFEGLNWALIRCVVPPEVPGTWDSVTPSGFSKRKEGMNMSFSNNVEFELF